MATTTGAARIVLLVDGENFAATRAENLLAKAGELGSLAEVRVYGHFSNIGMKGWRDAAERWGLVKVDVTVTGSNTADFKLIVEAMDILHGRRIDAFGIASADTGFATLAERIRASAVRAYGFSDRKTSSEYQRRFDTFFDFTKKTTRGAPPKAKTQPPPPKPVEKKPAPKRTASPSPRSTQPAVPRPTRGAPKATLAKQTAGISAEEATSVRLDALLEAIQKSAGNDGWSHFRDVGHQLSRSGYKKSQFKLPALRRKYPDSIEIEQRGTEKYIRVRMI